MFELFFDVETKKFFDDTGTSNPADLGVSVVSTFFREIDDEFRQISGKMQSFWEKDFDTMWKFFLEADRIVGYNSVHFDVPALKPYAPAGFDKLPHFDILEKISDGSGHRTSLSRVARDTLGDDKTDFGGNAIVYWNKGDAESLEKLRTYCEADVDLTKRIYDFAFINKKLKFTDHWNNPREIEVDFSYPAGFSPAGKQTSLF